MSGGGDVIRTVVLAFAMACAPSGGEDREEEGSPVSGGVEVSAVRWTGTPGDYTFFVSLLSDETGCDRYADWWEVVSPDGALIYRRILDHSHPNEQPFERSGGPVEVGVDDEWIIRGHLEPGGFGSIAMRGSISAGAASTTLEEGFAEELESVDPQPGDCLF